MQVDVRALDGSKLRTMELDDSVFGIEPHEAVLHQAVVTQQANARQGTHDTRTRGDVAGGGKKPYRQKGTGHARQGSTRAPHYRGGGVVFGPHPRTHALQMPRKMRRLALRSALSAHAQQNTLTVVADFAVEAGKTQTLLRLLATLGVGDKALVVLGQRNEAALRAAKNVADVHVVTPNGLNLQDLLRLPRLVLDEAAITELTERLATSPRRAGASSTPTLAAEVERQEEAGRGAE